MQKDRLDNMKKWYGKTIDKGSRILDSDISFGLTENKINTYERNIMVKTLY